MSYLEKFTIRFPARDKRLDGEIHYRGPARALTKKVSKQWQKVTDKGKGDVASSLVIARLVTSAKSVIGLHPHIWAGETTPALL